MHRTTTDRKPDPAPTTAQPAPTVRYFPTMLLFGFILAFWVLRNLPAFAWFGSGLSG
jgi:hypothetical protein